MHLLMVKQSWFNNQEYQFLHLLFLLYPHFTRRPFNFEVSDPIYLVEYHSLAINFNTKCIALLKKLFFHLKCSNHNWQSIMITLVFGCRLKLNGGGGQYRVAGFIPRGDV